MVGGYFLRIVIVTIRVASAINTSVYVNISANVTIAAPPVEEVDNLAALTGFAYLIICFRFLSILPPAWGGFFIRSFWGRYSAAPARCR